MMHKEISVPISNFLKKHLLLRFGKKTVLKNTFFGQKSFYCSSGVEVFRTTKYGGEASALGAFLFLLKADDCLWDIGASIGLFSVYATDKCKQVISFEPDPAIYNRLRENIALNKAGLDGKVKTFQYALGKECSTMTLHSDGINGFSPSLLSLNRHTHKTEVPVKT